ncbi:MAG: T9SS type A sorting domain-containing protein [Ignavibacteriales bacterium]|nr:T9SS type A sorting domain-containing protein [Ignavibacteriales bacterium]
MKSILFLICWLVVSVAIGQQQPVYTLVSSSIGGTNGSVESSEYKVEFSAGQSMAGEVSSSVYSASSGILQIVVLVTNPSDTTQYRTFKADTSLSKKAVSLAYKYAKINAVKVGSLKVKPNLVTAVSEVFRRYGKKGATFLGIAQEKATAGNFGWIAYSKSADVGKFYTAAHDTNRNFPIDSVRNLTTGKATKKLVKLVKADKKKYNNYFWEQAIAFKLNLLASDTGVTPKGLGALQLDIPVTLAGKELQGKSLVAVSKEIDTVATYWKSKSVDDATDYAELKAVANVLKQINDGFSVPMDSTNYLVDSLAVVKGTTATGGKKNPYAVTLLGVKTASDVGIVRYVPSTKSERLVYGTGEEDIPMAFKLEQNYPNPFNPSTTLSFVLPTSGGQVSHSSLVSLNIYNVLGQEVATLIHNRLMDEGMHEIQFDASKLSSGVYFYRLSSTSVESNETISLVKKMVLMR